MCLCQLSNSQNVVKEYWWNHLDENFLSETFSPETLPIEIFLEVKNCPNNSCESEKENNKEN